MSATDIIDNPFAVFVIAVVTQAGAAFIGDRLRRKRQPLKKDEQNDLDTVLTATLTLLALIIGFSFSMAVSRYDQRKNYEEAEAKRSEPNISARICCRPKMRQSSASF